MEHALVERLHHLTYPFCALKRLDIRRLIHNVTDVGRQRIILAIRRLM